MNISAVVVTRGNVDLTEVLEPLQIFSHVVVWDNSERQDLSVYGRYAALEEVRTHWVYVQDDDCVIDDPERIVQVAEEGFVVCNMPQEFRHEFYLHHGLVGFGAVFERDAPAKAFKRFADGHPRRLKTPVFRRTCDVAFTALTPRKLVDIPVRLMPWATDADRMYRSETHVAERAETLRLALAVRNA